MAFAAPGSASLSCLREKMPSLAQTLCKCHSHGAGAEEQLGADLPVGPPVPGVRGDLHLLLGQVPRLAAAAAEAGVDVTLEIGKFLRARVR
jgi:hypothetical protein